jgi:hypothetical protein
MDSLLVLVKVKTMSQVLNPQLLEYLKDDSAISEQERVLQTIDFFKWLSKNQGDYVLVSKDVHYYTHDEDRLFLSRLENKDWLFDEVRLVGEKI